jgi:hypothetical protein
VGSAAGGAGAEGGNTGAGTQDDPKYACNPSYEKSILSTNLEYAFVSDKYEIWFKSHPQYGIFPYLPNQECYVSIRLFGGGISGRSLKLDVMEGNLSGSSYLSIRENKLFTTENTGNVAGITQVQPVQAGWEERYIVSFKFVSGPGIADQGQGFLIRVTGP